MRVSRLVIVGLSALVAMHIFMLAGHGHGYNPFVGMRGVTAQASMATPESLTTATGDGDGDGMFLEMTVACLAVMAGLLFLQPKQRRHMAPSPVDEPSRPGIWPGTTREDPECDHLRSSASR